MQVHKELVLRHPNVIQRWDLTTNQGRDKCSDGDFLLPACIKGSLLATTGRAQLSNRLHGENGYRLF